MMYKINIIVFLSFYIQITCSAQENRDDYYKSFYSTFFNKTNQSNIFRKKLEIIDYIAGDSLNKPYKAEIIGNIYRESIPIKFTFKLKKVKSKKVNSFDKFDTTSFFLYINDFRYSNILDSIENGLSKKNELDIEKLIQIDIEESSKNSLNKISLLRSQSKKLKNVYFLKSDCNIGQIIIRVNRKDIKIITTYSQSIDIRKNKILSIFFNQSYFFDRTKILAYQLFELLK